MGGQRKVGTLAPQWCGSASVLSTTATPATRLHTIVCVCSGATPARPRRYFGVQVLIRAWSCPGPNPDAFRFRRPEKRPEKGWWPDWEQARRREEQTRHLACTAHMGLTKKIARSGTGGPPSEPIKKESAKPTDPAKDNPGEKRGDDAGAGSTLEVLQRKV